MAVGATMTVMGSAVDGHSEDAFYMAARYSLPDQAWGAPMPHTTLLTAHRAAWQLVKLDERSEMKAILIEPDAVRRIALTLCSSLPGSIQRNVAGARLICITMPSTSACAGAEARDWRRSLPAARFLTRRIMQWCSNQANW